jgi:transposase-like protein
LASARLGLAGLGNENIQNQVLTWNDAWPQLGHIRKSRAHGRVPMTKPPVPLTALSEEQRAQAQSRFAIIRPALEDGITQAQVARSHNIPASTIQRWVKRYRNEGLAGLLDRSSRSDKGKSRRLPPDAITLIEGLASQTPPRSMAVIHRQVVSIAEEQGWKPPGYDRVRQIIKNLDPALVTLAHQGAAAYREEFDLLYRREATHANAMWQTDHTPLDVWLLKVSLKEIERFRSIGSSYPAISNGVRYPSGFGLCCTHRKRGADLVRSIFLFG